jgi:hypothetical protein
MLILILACQMGRVASGQAAERKPKTANSVLLTIAFQHCTTEKLEVSHIEQYSSQKRLSIRVTY